MRRHTAEVISELGWRHGLGNEVNGADGGTKGKKWRRPVPEGFGPWTTKRSHPFSTEVFRDRRVQLREPRTDSGVRGLSKVQGASNLGTCHLEEGKPVTLGNFAHHAPEVLQALALICHEGHQFSLALHDQAFGPGPEPEH
mgnify:CR=1 FL=1